jgi:hypothetical protein
MRILVGSIIACLTTSAFAEPGEPESSEPGTKYELGARVAVMPASWVGGSFADGKTNGKNSATGVGVKIYGDVQVAPHLHIGVAIPSVIGGVGPTSAETDIGLGPRIVADAALTAVTGGYVAFEPAVIAAHLPGGEWWTGYQASLAAGVRIALTDSINMTAEVVLQPTAISGTVNFPFQMDPPVQGTVKTIYFGGGAGLETHF